MSKFKPLASGHHSHADQSLDGGSTVESKIIKADKLGRVADCLTDHGGMGGLIDHWLSSLKLAKSGKTSKKIQSIHGIELYVVDERRPPKVFKNGKTEFRYSHLTVHFLDSQAYTYFCQLSPLMESRAVVKWGERKPLIFLRELEPIAGHITISSGCLMGLVMKNILGDRNDESLGITKPDRIEWAVADYERLRSIAGKDNWWVEVFPHCIDHDHVSPVFKNKQLVAPGHFKPILNRDHVCGPDCVGAQHFQDECGHLCTVLDIQKESNLFVIEMARKYGDPIVVSEDSHVADSTDKITQDCRMGNGREQFQFYNNLCMRDSDEWADNLQKQLDVPDRDIEEWIDNSYKFVDRFKEYRIETSKDRLLLPTTEMVYGVNSPDSITKMHQLIKEHGRMPDESHPQYQIYKDRLDYEISVLHDNGVADFLPYCFVIEDAARWAREKGLTCNMRGSGGGVLIAYLLRMSITDPIKYGLQFERFMTLDRIRVARSLPDFDTDWEDKGPIIDYILKKYGTLAAMISTNMLLRVKSSIKDVERFRKGQVDQKTHVLLRMIKGAPQGANDKDWLFGYTDKTTGAHVKGFLDEDSPLAEEFRQYIKTAHWTDESGNKRLLWDDVQRCLGVTRSKGVHAGGIVITPSAVANYMPLMMSKKEGLLATSMTMKGVEEVGGVKYDFLGVKTLKSIGITMRALKKDRIVDLDWREFPHDPCVYEKVIHRGLLGGLFQISTSTMAPFVNAIKPNSVDDLSAICAIVRPGALDAPSPDPSDPMDITAAKYFVLCCQGKKNPYYIHPELEPILSRTRGVLVYQEDALRIFRDIGGYTYAQAESARRGIGKKDKVLLDQCVGDLKRACLVRGWTEQQTNRLAETVIKSANYSFNYAHSASYAIVAYNGAYLKHHYPAHFWLGELEVRTGDQDKIRELLRECGQYVLDVNVEKSDPVHWKIEEVNGVKKLRPPLVTIKGCGLKSMENLRMFIDAQSPQDLIVQDVSADADEPETTLNEDQDDNGNDSLD